MTEPFRILIAVDGSANALAAARCWSAWPEPSSQPLHVRLLTVVPPLPQVWPVAQAEAGRRESALAALGQGPLEWARECYAATRLVWEAAVRVGAPASVIVEEAQHGHADLIVMGSRGLTPLNDLLLGSVALCVAQTSPCRSG